MCFQLFESILYLKVTCRPCCCASCEVATGSAGDNGTYGVTKYNIAYILYSNVAYLILAMMFLCTAFALLGTKQAYVLAGTIMPLARRFATAVRPIYGRLQKKVNVSYL